MDTNKKMAEYDRRRYEALEREVGALRAALELIASRGIVPRPGVYPSNPLAEAQGCATCMYWWDAGDDEHHSPTCAYIVARDALANSVTLQVTSEKT